MAFLRHPPQRLHLTVNSLTLDDAVALTRYMRTVLAAQPDQQASDIKSRLTQLLTISQLFAESGLLSSTWLDDIQAIATHFNINLENTQEPSNA